MLRDARWVRLPGGAAIGTAAVIFELEGVWRVTDDGPATDGPDMTGVEWDAHCRF